MPAKTRFAPIEVTAAYPLPEFQRRVGWGEAALRTARRAGLKLRYSGGRVFVIGADFLDYLSTAPTAAPQERAAGTEVSRQAE